MSNLTPTKLKHGNKRDTDIILTEMNLKSYNYKISNAKSWFSLFCSSVEDEELALGDPGLLTEFPLDELDDEEEDSF